MKPRIFMVEDEEEKTAPPFIPAVGVIIKMPGIPSLVDLRVKESFAKKSVGCKFPPKWFQLGDHGEPVN